MGERVSKQKVAIDNKHAEISTSVEAQVAAQAPPMQQLFVLKEILKELKKLNAR